MPVRPELCPLCSEPVPDDAALCLSCGAELAEPTGEAVAAGRPAEVRPTAGDHPASRTRGWRLLEVFALVLGLGGLMALAAEPVANSLGTAVGQTLFALGLLLIVVGGGLLLLGGAALGIAKLAWAVASAVGLVAHDKNASAAVEPQATGPAWRVILPDGPHTVQLADVSLRPAWVSCDGSPTPLRWPILWIDSKATFEVAGHQARIVLRRGWGTWILTMPIAAVLGDTASQPEHRHALAVDGGVVQADG